MSGFSSGGALAAMHERMRGASAADDVGFMSQGVGAVARMVGDKLRELVSVLDFGAGGVGLTDDTEALQAALTAGAGKCVIFPAGKYKTTAELIVPSGTLLLGAGLASKIVGAGTHSIFKYAHPSTGIAAWGLNIDGNKTAGTADVVTLLYAPANLASPATKNKNLTVTNCRLVNASAAIGFENATNCTIQDNHIERVYRHTSGAHAGVYGYGIVLNGCTGSKVARNTIGTPENTVDRHGVYMPVFRDQDAAPTVTVLSGDIQISDNRIHVQHNSVADPFSSCIEGWNMFDVSVVGNTLVGGIRGFNARPAYQNGGRLHIVGNSIRGSTICVRTGSADYGVAKETLNFEKVTVSDNDLVPLAGVNGQAVKLEGVKSVIFTGNYCNGTDSGTAAFLYHGANSIVADVIVAHSNVISGFLQGFYLKDVLRFTDESTFKSFTGTNPIPYRRISAITSSAMTPNLAPVVSLYQYSGVDWSGVEYFEPALNKRIRYDGAAWVDLSGLRVRGTTAQRPSGVSVSSDQNAASPAPLTIGYGFRYFDTDIGALIYWNGIVWATTQNPAPPRSGTTAELNQFKADYPLALHYGATAWNTTTSKAVSWDEYFKVWRYGDGTAI